MFMHDDIPDINEEGMPLGGETLETLEVQLGSRI